MDCLIHSNTNGRYKLPNSKQFWKENNNVALSVLLRNNSSTYEVCHLFVLPWVTDLDKFSFCPYRHYSSCWSLPFQAHDLCVPSLHCFSSSFHCTPPYFDMSSKGLLCSQHLISEICLVHQDMFTWLALLIYLKLLRRIQFSLQTASTTLITHFLESLDTPMPVTENLLAGRFFNKVMTICKTISVSIELLW